MRSISTKAALTAVAFLFLFGGGLVVPAQATSEQACRIGCDLDYAAKASICEDRYQDCLRTAEEYYYLYRKAWETYCTGRNEPEGGNTATVITAAYCWHEQRRLARKYASDKAACRRARGLCLNFACDRQTSCYARCTAYAGYPG